MHVGGANLAFGQPRHTPSTPTHDRKDPQLRVRAEDDEQKRDGFLCCHAPVRVRVGHPKEGNIDDDKDASKNDRRDRKKRKTGQNWAFGCLEATLSASCIDVKGRQGHTLREL